MKNTSYQLLIILLAVGSFVTGTSEFVVSGILDIISVDLHISIPAAGTAHHHLFSFLCRRCPLFSHGHIEIESKKGSFIGDFHVYSRECARLF